jgi:hypothetical protein
LPSLQEYYAGQSHSINDEDDYPKFVTPDAVKSVAENIRNITRNTPYDDEEFANVVLSIVRQIPYVRSTAKYPVETLVDNEADCDGLSILAASILKAGGLDAVLLLYKGIRPSHMNVGVSLERMPVSHAWWMAPSGIEYANKTYWIAECTSLADWTVGARPELLSLDKPQIIQLEECEKKSPASISSSLIPMEQSSISISLSTRNVGASGNKQTINVSGSISPSFANKSVSLYVTQPNLSPSVLDTFTDDSGNYVLLWNVTLPGTYVAQTCWSGSSNFSGSESEALTVFAGAKPPELEAPPEYYMGDSYSGVPSWTSSPAYLAMLSQGGKEFLKGSLPGPNVVLSGDFMILSDGREQTPKEATITIPAYKITYRLPRTRQLITIEIPEKKVTVPGAEPLKGQFGFMLKSDGGNNYTASVRLLTNDETSRITTSEDESTGLFMNASEVAAKNIWRKAIAKVSGDEVAIEICDENGTRLDSMVNTATDSRNGELGIVMTYPLGQVLAFKNLKIEALGLNPTSTAKASVEDAGIDFLFPYVRISLLLAGVVLVILCMHGRRGRRNSSIDNENNETSTKSLGH